MRNGLRGSNRSAAPDGNEKPVSHGKFRAGQSEQADEPGRPARTTASSIAERAKRRLADELRGGDRRSIGKSNIVVGRIVRDPARFAGIIDGLTDDDPLVRMRCADVAEKVSRQHPDWLQSYKRRLLELAATSIEKEVRWHLAQMLPRLNLERAELRRTTKIMFGYLNDESRIVKTFAMQALADLAARDPDLRTKVPSLLQSLAETGSPAVRARARRLISSLTKSKDCSVRRRAHLRA